MLGLGVLGNSTLGGGGGNAPSSYSASLTESVTANLNVQSSCVALENISFGVSSIIVEGGSINVAAQSVFNAFVDLVTVSNSNSNNSLSLLSNPYFITSGGFPFSESISFETSNNLSIIASNAIFPCSISLISIDSEFAPIMQFSPLGIMELSSSVDISQSFLLTISPLLQLPSASLISQQSMLDALNLFDFESVVDLTQGVANRISSDILILATSDFDSVKYYNAFVDINFGSTASEILQSSADYGIGAEFQSNAIFSEIASNLIIPFEFPLQIIHNMIVTPFFAPLGVFLLPAESDFTLSNTTSFRVQFPFTTLSSFDFTGKLDIQTNESFDSTVDLVVGCERILSFTTDFPMSSTLDFGQKLDILGILTLNSTNSLDFTSILSALERANIYFNADFSGNASIGVQKSIEMGVSTSQLTTSVLNSLSQCLLESSAIISEGSTHSMVISLVLPVGSDLQTASKLAIELGLAYISDASLESQVSTVVPTGVSFAVASAFSESATLTVSAIASLLSQGSFVAKQFESFNTYTEALAFASAVSFTNEAILNGFATLAVVSNSALSMLSEDFRIDKNYTVVILEKREVLLDTSDRITFRSSPDSASLILTRR
jgi:hypothetical protein